MHEQPPDRETAAACRDDRAHDLSGHRLEVGGGRDDGDAVTAAARDADEGDVATVEQHPAGLGVADQKTMQAGRGAADGQRPVEQGAARQSRQGRCRGQASRRRRRRRREPRATLLAPGRDGSVEGRDHGDHPDRAPGFRPSVARARRGHRRPSSRPTMIARPPAGLDRPLDFGECGAADLPGLDRDQLDDRVAVLAQKLGEVPHERVAIRRRNPSPVRGGDLGGGDRAFDLRAGRGGDLEEVATADRRPRQERGLRLRRRLDSTPREARERVPPELLRRGDGNRRRGGHPTKFIADPFRTIIC